MIEPLLFSCALVTGASSGLGEEFAFQIASRVSKLVLVARREPLLEILAERVREMYPHVAVAVYSVDLNHSAEREQLVANLRQSGFVKGLVYAIVGVITYPGLNMVSLQPYIFWTINCKSYFPTISTRNDADFMDDFCIVGVNKVHS